jgi:hypothetical protein
LTCKYLLVCGRRCPTILCSTPSSSFYSKRVGRWRSRERIFECSLNSIRRDFMPRSVAQRCIRGHVWANSGANANLSSQIFSFFFFVWSVRLSPTLSWRHWMTDPMRHLCILAETDFYIHIAHSRKNFSLVRVHGSGNIMIWKNCWRGRRRASRAAYEARRKWRFMMWNESEKLVPCDLPHWIIAFLFSIPLVSRRL